MYSPADLPSSWRAAPAKKRRLSAENGISSRDTISGLPTFRDSIWASSSAFASITSASLCSSSERSFGVASSHSGSAFFARSTASSTSSADMFGTCAMVSPVAGLRTSSVLSVMVAIHYLLFSAKDPTLARQALRERDGDDGHSEDQEDDDVHLRQLLAEPDLAEDPDRERVLRASGKRGDDHLVEREREREQAARDERRRDRREGDVAERLPAVGAEIHRRLGERARHAAQARDHVVVDDDHAERRVSDHDCQQPEVEPPVREVRVERHAGDDSGQRDREDEQERDRLAPEEAEPVHPERRHRAEHERGRRRERRRLQREPERLLHVAVVNRGREPPCRQPGDRPALDVRLVERVEADDRDRYVQEREHERDPDPERGAGGARFHHDSITAPRRRRAGARSGGRPP